MEAFGNFACNQNSNSHAAKATSGVGKAAILFLFLAQSVLMVALLTLLPIFHDRKRKGQKSKLFLVERVQKITKTKRIFF